MSIKKIIMKRDGLSSKEADELIAEAKEAIQEYLEYGDTESAYEVCSEFFGLEPDYLFELIDI